MQYNLHKNVLSIFHGSWRSPVSIHLFSDSVDLLLHLKLFEDRTEGVGDYQDHDEETNKEDDKRGKDCLHILRSWKLLQTFITETLKSFEDL